MGLSELYQKSLMAFWNYTHNTQYSPEHRLSEEELLSVTPDQLYAFFAFKVYGIPDPDESDNPTFGRSSSIEYHKKAISYFMPNRLPHWDVRTMSGNPTKSVKVNDLIKRVKKIGQETRFTFSGKAANADIRIQRNHQKMLEQQ